MTFKGILAGLAALLVGGVCIGLGFWQLSRLEERRARNARVEAAMAIAPVPLSRALLDSIRANPEPFRYRRVRASGTFDTAGTFLLRGRARQGAPGVHLVSPLRLDGGGERVLVDRGWLPSPDAATADPRPYHSSAPVVVDGALEPILPPSADDRPLEVSGDGYSVRTARTVSAGSTPDGDATLPIYLRQLPDAEDADRLPRPPPPPALDEGPHLGYALQWFSFAAIAIGGFVVVALRKRASA